MWRRGDQVVLRNRKQGRISWVTPVTVVEDSPDCIALYVMMDTPLKRPVELDGTPIPRALSYGERFVLPWRLGDGRWRDRSVLWIARPGEFHSVGIFWEGINHQFIGWYVNLQDPLVRFSAGFDTVDHVLDLKVAPDGSWHWKDEDEFADAQRVGRFTADEASAIRAEGEAVISAIEQRACPFDESWQDWRPDESWTVPPFPEGWDVE